MMETVELVVVMSVIFLLSVGATLIARDESCEIKVNNLR